jgi:Lrp/AsnC family transcriptional regulator for asnA, asnC and gidA/Lrp/AsnC family leucine-responsive transcriptional regulator
MDEIDDAILRELQKDGRKSMAELGSMLGIAPSTVFKRIEKLKKAGIIERFTIVINQKCFENIPAVLDLYEVLEPGDFFARVRVQNISELKRDILVPLSSLPGVRDIQTIISVRRIKEQT